MPETQAENTKQTHAGNSHDASPTLVTFPDGGWTAWLTVAGGAVVSFSTFGAIQSFGVFQDYYTRFSLNDSTPSDVSWIGSFQIFLFFAMGIVSGKWFDNGYFHLLMAFGSLIYLFSFLMLSLTHPHHYYQTFLCQGIGMGVGVGLLFLPALSLTTHYFRARRSTAMGMIFSGTSIGGVIFPIMLNRFFHGSVGFQWGVRIAAFMVLGLLAIANLMMRTRLPSRRKDRPSGVQPELKKFLADVPFMIAIGGEFLIYWGIFFPFFYLQLFAIQHNVDQNLAFYSISILNGASFFGRTIPNFLADSIGVFNVVIPMCFVSGVLIFAMFGAGNPAGMIVFSILYGFFSGGFVSLSASITASFATSVDELGLRMGLAMFILAFAILTGTPISGALTNPPVYSWSRPIIFNSVVILVGTGMLIISRSIVVKRKGTWRV